MDLLSLPKEMLALAIKNFDAETLVTARKMNKKIDVLARNAKLHERLSVVNFQVYTKNDDDFGDEIIIRIELEKRVSEAYGLNEPCYDFAYEEGSMFNLLEEYLPRVMKIMTKRPSNSDEMGTPHKKRKMEIVQTMNLNSLPDEIMARVLKHTNYPTLAGLRKMDRRIDIIARKYDVGTRLPVLRLSCLPEPRNGNQTSIRLNFAVEAQIAHYIDPSLRGKPREWKKKDDPYQFTFEGNDQDCLDKQYEYVLNKIKVSELHLVGNHTKFESHMITALLKQSRSLRYISSLRIYIAYSSLAFSKETIHKLITNCPNLQNLYVIARRSDVEVICDKEILNGRQWKKMCLYGGFCSHFFTGLNMDFLEKVVKNCAHFECGGMLVTFNINEFAQFIKKCAEEKHFFTSQNWKFGCVPAENETRAELINRLKNISEIKYEAYNNMFCTHFKITVPANPEVAIIFKMINQ